MALMKPVPTPYGVQATYHIVGMVQTHFVESCVDVVMASYLDEAVRRGGASPLGSIQPIRLSFADLDCQGEPSRPAIYAALKRLESWDTATDA